MFKLQLSNDDSTSKRLAITEKIGITILSVVDEVPKMHYDKDDGVVSFCLGAKDTTTPPDPIDPIDPVDPVDPPDPIDPGGGDGGDNGGGGGIIVNDFDFAVIRYRWDSNAGRDLDTRTFISDPPRNVVIGWNKGEFDGQFLSWGGDNTNSGVEAILINVKALSEMYPELTNIQVMIQAFWYSELLSGNVEIEFTTYKGGSMVKSGFDFLNYDGVNVQTNKLNVNLTSKEREMGEPLAKLSYNPKENKGPLEKIVATV